MKKRLKPAPSLLNAILVAIMICGGSEAWPQLSANAAPAPADQPKALFINILEGEGALNDVRTRTAREPIVEVDDENHKPVAGVLVLFAMDNGGGSPFASFSGVQTLSVKTDTAGRAVGHGFQITQRKGHYKIDVHASVGTVVADAVIAETNVAMAVNPSGTERPAGSLTHLRPKWIIGGVVAIGVVAGIVIATQQSSPTTLTTGSGHVGAPTAIHGGIHFEFGRPHP